MSCIVRKFQKFGKRTIGVNGVAYGSEPCANTLRNELYDIERDTERAVSQAQRMIDRERVRDGER